MIVAIHQPQYLPWLGYFDKIDQSDVFCFLDNVQYKKNEWQNRNRIKTAQGWQWLTVPVNYRFPQKINEVTISRRIDWRRKHFQSICTHYGKARYFSRYIDFFESVYNRDWEFVCHLNIFLIERICDMLNLKKLRMIRASAMELRDEPTDRLIDICRHLDADTYLAGAGGAGYMDMKRFEETGIKLRFQDFINPVYPQVFNEFQSHLSVLDLIMNCGPDSLSVIRAAQCNRV